MTSFRLCVGTFVAIPTAMPLAPFTRKFGMRVGMTVGSLSVSSKLFIMSTVSLSISCIMASPRGLSFASVYRMAAGESPSTEPKFPCPFTKG